MTDYITKLKKVIVEPGFAGLASEARKLHEEALNGVEIWNDISRRLTENVDKPLRKMFPHLRKN